MALEATKQPIPNDTKDLIDKLRRPHTIIIMGGGGKESRLGDAIAGQLTPMTEDRRRLEVHIGRFNRFRERWTRWQDNPRKSRIVERCVTLVTDIRLWECAKARIDPTNEEYRAWFFSLSAYSRMMLVDQELERIASERRFRMNTRQWWR